MFNGRYAWFFFIPATDAAAEAFKQWATEQWADLRRKLIDRAGWPVLHLPKASWPLDPRMLPGSPVAMRELETDIGQSEKGSRQ